MTAYSKRVVFTMGGKGGVGKTGVMVSLAEWFASNKIPVTLLDLDTENKARGSLKHFFNGTVTKVNIHTPAGLDAFVDYLDGGTPLIGSNLCMKMSRQLAFALLRWAWSRQTRPALRASLPGQTAFRIGWSMSSSKTLQAR
jgi:hypothetical protein